MSGSFLRRMRSWARPRISLGIITILLVSAAAGGCYKAAPPKMSKSARVVVTTPVFSEVTDYQDFTGRMDALKTVDIRPRVSGYIVDAPFVEGDVVKEGELLFRIDPRPYQHDLNQAKANLKLAEADVRLQGKRLARGRELLARGVEGTINAEEIDQLVAAVEKAIANVGAMKAAVERAALNLEFTEVKVPKLRDDKGNRLEGRISRRMVDPGNLVNADQTILTTMVSIDPMYAYFDVDERTYLELAALTTPGSSSYSALQFPVLMRLANEDEFQRRGYVNFLDNRLSANTGTVRMRGLFDNPGGLLKPSLFARIRLPVGAPYKALLVPDEAILSDQGRKYVYVVEKVKNAKGEEVEQAEYRDVQPGQALQGLRVIKEGVKEGERVIISGMQRVRAKAVVEATVQEPPKPPQSSLTKSLNEDRPATDSLKQAPAAPDLKDMPRLRGGSQHGGKGQR